MGKNYLMIKFVFTCILNTRNTSRLKRMRKKHKRHMDYSESSCVVRTYKHVECPAGLRLETDVTVTSFQLYTFITLFSFRLLELYCAFKSNTNRLYTAI